MKILLYYHTGSRNHGCEAIVRTLCDCFKEDEIILYSYDATSDRQFGLDQYATIKEYLPRKKYNIPERSKIRLHLYQEGQECFKEMLQETEIDWAFAIGGDSYCYKGQPEEMAYINREWHKKNVKTALIGCSINEDVVARKKVKKDLNQYDAIYAREPLTYNFLLKYHIGNVFLFPDTAFTLLSQEDDNMKNLISLDYEYVGINVSPLISKGESEKGIIIKNYLNLINYVLEKKNYRILLIPHVCVEWDNDLSSLNIFYEKYRNTGRVFLMKEANCCILKGYVAKCKYVICARTHVSIAAYSQSIPTVVVGYSIKSKGIANDLFGTDDKYVISAEKITTDDRLVHAYQWLENNEQEIITRLRQKEEEYKGLFDKYTDSFQQ